MHLLKECLTFNLNVQSAKTNLQISNLYHTGWLSVTFFIGHEKCCLFLENDLTNKRLSCQGNMQY